MALTHTDPTSLFTAAQVRELDRRAIEEHGIAGFTLMSRAGEAAFRLLSRYWPKAKRLVVVCGTGNNGGDGYVVARHGLAARLATQVLQVGEPQRLRGDAARARQAYLDAGGQEAADAAVLRSADVIVDGLLGTGLERPVSGVYADLVQAMNAAPAPVLALDLPSGLHSDTGAILGICVQAAATVTFIGIKQGLLTGAGPDQVGELNWAGLEVPAAVYAGMVPAAQRLDASLLAERLPPRARGIHKGDCGHVLVIGGGPGMSGAARMAAEAAARVGAGLVSVATHPSHAAWLNLERPELMVHAVQQAAALQPLLARAAVVALGPGLGQDDWAVQLFAAAVAADLPLVVDADALNLLVRYPLNRSDWILTPHPGEAGRLLERATAAVQADRFAALQAVRERYGGVGVLKGAGTLIGHPAGVSLCAAGNPGMAAGGMGDVLTGVIAGLLAQRQPLAGAAEIGVLVHALAADSVAAAQGERGMLATDLLPWLPHWVNPCK